MVINRRPATGAIGDERPGGNRFSAGALLFVIIGTHAVLARYLFSNYPNMRALYAAVKEKKREMPEGGGPTSPGEVLLL